MSAPPVDIKIKGVKQLDAGARRLFENIEHAEGQDAVRPTAEQTAATVRARTRVRTGRLRASVHVVTNGNVSSVRMGEGVHYARWTKYPKLVYPTAKRTERAFRKHAETVCASEIRSMRWPTPGL